MPAARAHVYWGGTFGDEEKRSLVQQALPPALDCVVEDLESVLKANPAESPVTSGSIRNTFCRIIF